MATKFRDYIKLYGKVDAQGRLLIPAEIREKLQIKPDEKLILIASEDELTVTTVAGSWRRIQRIMEPYRDPSRSAVDELIAERRAEAERE